MKTFGNIIMFLLLVVGGYTWFSNSIPQLKAEPPVEEEVSLEGLTIEKYAAMGQKIFEGKGTCPLCHNKVGHRAPILVEASEDGPALAARAEERLKDERYKGEAKTGEEYIRESMFKPSAFVVAGFGKKGTDDTVSPMPNVSKGAISLSEIEIGAVISYLQSVAGVEVTVQLPTGKIEVADEEVAIKVAENAQEAFAKFECGTCHIHPLIEEGGDVGPALDNMDSLEKDAKEAGLPMEQYLVKSIIDPNAFIVSGGDYEADMMPGDLSDRMTVTELYMIVDAIMGKEAGK